MNEKLKTLILLILLALCWITIIELLKTNQEPAKPILQEPSIEITP